MSAKRLISSVSLIISVSTSNTPHRSTSVGKLFVMSGAFSISIDRLIMRRLSSNNTP